MPLYECMITNAIGKKEKIFREAFSDRELIASIESHVSLISYKQIQHDDRIIQRKHYNKESIILFTDMISNLLKSGLTIKDSIAICGSISSDKQVGFLCADILFGLEKGYPFHKVIGLLPSAFSQLYYSLIRLGEKTGDVSGVFQRMSNYLHSQRKVKKKLMNAMIYPSMVLIFAVLGCIGIVVYVLPHMMEIVSAFKVNNDETVVLSMNAFISNIRFSLSLVVLSILAICFLKIFRKRNAGILLFTDRLLLRIPRVGEMLKAYQTLEFAFAMEMLIGAGIPMVSALREAATVVKNQAYADALLQVHEKIHAGDRLSDSLLAHDEFPSYLPTWISIGERTGKVENVFTQIREYYQQDVEQASDMIMTMIEPVITLVVGVVVLILIIQFVLPIFSLYGKVL